MTIRPPAHIEPYVRALGEEDAMRFFLRFGGAELYIARDPKGRGRLEQELGTEAARRLAALADETMLPYRVPQPKPWMAEVMRSRGLPVVEIARSLHVTTVSVRNWLKKADNGPREERQKRLF